MGNRTSYVVVTVGWSSLDFFVCLFFSPSFFFFSFLDEEGGKKAEWWGLGQVVCLPLSHTQILELRTKFPTLFLKT